MLNFLKNVKAAHPTLSIEENIVMSIPAELREVLDSKLQLIKLTHESLRELFFNANKIIKVFCPYIDPTFISLIEPVDCPIKVVTTPFYHRGPKGNPVLERCTLHKKMLVRYLCQKRSKIHMFQIHAKMIIVDQKAAYIGSANLTDTSIHYNLELGVILKDPAALQTLDVVFDSIFEKFAVPKELL